MSNFANLSCVPCNGAPDCNCLLGFKDTFSANDLSTWDCQPSTFQQPLEIVNSGYSINLDYNLVIWIRASSNVKPLNY